MIRTIHARAFRGPVARQGYSPFLLLIAVGTTLPHRAAAQEPKAAPVEVVFSLQQKPEKDFDVSGPDAAKLVTFEPAGMRIALPTGFPGLRPNVGLASGMAFPGDFEISLKYEIVAEPDAKDVGNFGTRLALTVGNESPGQTNIKLSRAVQAAKGGQFLTFTAEWQEGEGKHLKRGSGADAQAKSGRLRLVREGPTLFFYAADGAADFRLLRQYGFTTETLRDVRVVANTDGLKAAFDVRVTDLRIRAASAPGLPVPGLPKELAPAQAANDGRRALRLGAFGALLGAALLGVWLFIRRRRRQSQ
jgi:hypothetical protein